MNQPQDNDTNTDEDYRYIVPDDLKSFAIATRLGDTTGSDMYFSLNVHKHGTPDGETVTVTFSVPQVRELVHEAENFLHTHRNLVRRHRADKEAEKKAAPRPDLNVLLDAMIDADREGWERFATVLPALKPIRNQFEHHSGKNPVVEVGTAMWRAFADPVIDRMPVSIKPTPVEETRLLTLALDRLDEEAGK